MMTSAGVILLLLGLSGFVKAEDFEAALSPFEIYDEQRLLGGKYHVVSIKKG